MESLLKRLAPNYVALAKLGEGGMGTVYRVRHRHLDEIRVAKLMRHALRRDEKLLARFRHEAQLLSGLTHPNIAKIFELFVDDEGDAAIIMEWVAGEDLRHLCRRAGPVPLATGLEIGRQTLSALDHLHQRQYVHRDISPDNLMVTWQTDLPDGGAGVQVKMIDLGIAKSLEDNAGMTATGNFLGKVRYSSPERLSADGRLDPRSDLYSFAVVLYEALTGHCPIQGTAPESLISGHLFRRPKGFEETDPDGKIPPAVRAVLLQLLAKKPEDRPASALELLQTWSTLQAAHPIETDVESRWTRHIRAATELLHEDRLAVERTLSVTASVTATVGSQAFGPAADPSEPTVGLEAIATQAAADEVDERAPAASAAAAPDPAAAHDDTTTLLEGRTRIRRTQRSASILVGAGSLAALALLTGVGGWLWRQATTPTDDAVPTAVESEALSPEDPSLQDLDADSGRGGLGASDLPTPNLDDAADARDAFSASESPAAARTEAPAPSPQLGRWTFDAVPWAELVSVTDSEGRAMPLPANAHTPLALELLPGSYVVELRSPQLGLSRRLTLTVRPGDDRRSTVTFEEVEPDALLRSLGW